MIDGFKLGLDGDGALLLKGSITGGIGIASKAATIALPRKTIDQPEALPFRIDIDASTLQMKFLGTLTLPCPSAATLWAQLDLPRVLIRAKSDPSLLLALHVTFEQSYDSGSGQMQGRITRLDIVEPYLVKLVATIARDAADAAAALFRLVSAILIPSPGASDTAILAPLHRRFRIVPLSTCPGKSDHYTFYNYRRINGCALLQQNRHGSRNIDRVQRTMFGVHTVTSPRRHSERCNHAGPDGP